MESTKKGKLFGKFNFFDLFIVIVIIAVIVGGVTYVARGKSKSVSSSTITYEIEFVDVPEYVAPVIKEGDVLEDGTETYAMGTIKSVISNEVMKNVVSDTINGKFSSVNSPENKRQVIVSVETSYTLTGGGGKNIENYSLGTSMDLKVGKSVTVKSQSYQVQGYIVSVG